jgi:hypothetical protein
MRSPMPVPWGLVGLRIKRRLTLRPPSGLPTILRGGLQFGMRWYRCAYAYNPMRFSY